MAENVEVFPNGHPDLPPEAILWKGDDESTQSVMVWVQKTHPDAEVNFRDSMLGSLLAIDFGHYQVKARAGQFVVKNKQTGLFEAENFDSYRDKWYN